MYLKVVPIDYQTYITLDMNTLKLKSSQIQPLLPNNQSHLSLTSQMSDPSVIIDPPYSTDFSQTRPSWKEQSRRNHRSKKRRRHRSSSSSSSTSRSASLNSSRWRKKSKRSKHSHNKRRRRSMTPSSSSNTSQSNIDFGRYKRARRSPQVAQMPVPI